MFKYRFNMKIAILGANGHVGKVLSQQLSDLSPDLYGRLDEYLSYNDLFSREYDCIINAVGISNGHIIASKPASFFSLIESFELLLYKYSQLFANCKVLHISSGSIFGKNTTTPISAESSTEFYPNKLSTSDVYGITKFYFEMKHQFLPYNIIDVRLFGLFSQHQSLELPLFMSEVLDSLLHNKELLVDSNDFVRDFLCASDFGEFIKCCLKNFEKGTIDTYTRAPVSKFELLTELHKLYGLNYKVTNIDRSSLLGGVKSCYYSVNKSAGNIGYKPKYTSLEGIIKEIDLIIKNRNKNE